jgi:phi13 family phage major tail protein
MANKVKFNIKNCHYAVMDENNKYGVPVAMPGAVNISLSTQGELSKFYADGIAYYTSSSNGGYEGDLESAMISDQFRKEILNETEDANGVLLENANNETNKFAFGFEIDGDSKGTKFWFYNCSATRPNAEAATKEDTIEPQTDTITISCSPDMNGNVRVKSTENVNETVEANWFNEVYIPTDEPEVDEG